MEIEHLREEVSRLEANLLRLQNSARKHARDMQNSGKSRASRDQSGKNWEKSRREAQKVKADFDAAKARLKEAEASNSLKSLRKHREPNQIQPEDQHTVTTKEAEKTSIKNEERKLVSLESASEPDLLDPSLLAENINQAYAKLSMTNRELARANYLLGDYEGQKRRENAEILLDARTARTAEILLAGILDNQKHRDLVSARTRAELAHFDAKTEVERLKLLVRLAHVATESLDENSR